MGAESQNTEGSVGLAHTDPEQEEEDAWLLVAGTESSNTLHDFATR